MKVYRYLSIFPMIVGVLVGSSLGAKDECSATSQTYFAVRPQFQTGSPEYHSSMRTLRHECDENYHNFNVTVFGGRSTSTDNVARFFMPFGCPSVSVNGAIAENGTALLPENFNIFSTRFSPEAAAMFLPTGVTNIATAFASEMSFAPRQTVFGVGLTYNAQFEAYDCHWLFNASAPLVHVRNTMGLCEKVTQAGDFYDVQPIAGQATNLDQDVRTMTQAFAQSEWRYGKITCDTQTKTRLAFIELLFGREWHCSDACHFESFLGVTLPTGNTPDACTVFEPVAGNGGHVGIISHHAFGSQMWQGEEGDCALNFECDLVFQYLFARTHKRSFDLKYKPWSRYVGMYADKAQAEQASALYVAPNVGSVFLATPGINVLTQDVKVKPGFNAALNMALSFVREEGMCGFNGEAGYNFYAREAECLCLKGCLSDTAAIKDHVGSGVVNPVRNITNDRLTNEASVGNLMLRGLTVPQALDDYNGRVLKASDLDLSSAAHPCVIAHTFYGAVGYDWGDRECPVALRLGASYEFSGRTDTALNRWLLWGSFGIDF